MIPMAFVLGLLTASGNQTTVTATGEQLASMGGGLFASLALATALMIVVHMRYPLVVRLLPRADPLRGACR
jgi:hypothetical protein